MRIAVLLATAVISLPTTANAQEVTRITVRVTANDAKILGSGVGGARVVVRDAHTLDTLAHGVQQGATGSTDAIMRTPRARDATVFNTDGAAAFVAEIDIQEPTLVEIIGEGPLDTPHSMQRASKTIMAVPERHIDGEGIELKLHGFTIVLDQQHYAVESGGSFTVNANVTMLCGCPTEPGGLWDSNNYEMLATLLDAGQPVSTVPLEYSGTTSNYQATFTDLESGRYMLQVVVNDSDRANTGVSMAEVTVR